MKKLQIYVILIVIAIIVTASLVLNNIRIKNQKYTSRDIHFGVEMKYDNAEQKVEEIEKFISQRLSIARTEFEPWARTHKDQINKIRSADATEQILLEVYNTLPDKPMDCGINYVNMKEYPKYNRKVRSFGWQVIPKRYAPKDKLPEDIAQSLKEGLKKNRDIKIMPVGCVGKMQAQLWLSGRITITLLGDKLVNGAMEIVEVSEKEIAPPYDFITP